MIIAVACNEACGFTASGTMRIGRTAPRYVLSKSSKLAGSGKRVRVRLRLSKPGLEALRRALARHLRAAVTLRISARDAVGNETAGRADIRARR